MNHDMQAMSASEHDHAMMNMNHEMSAQSENKPKRMNQFMAGQMLQRQRV